MIMLGIADTQNAEVVINTIDLFIRANRKEMILLF